MNVVFTRFFLLVIALVAASSLCGQIIDNSSGEAFEEAGFFNPDFIRQNGIKRIEGDIMVKRDSRPISPEHQTLIYKFNRKGRQTMKAFVYGKKRNKKDTVASYFAYGPQHKLVAVGKTEGGGYGMRKLSYDDEGRVIKRDYERIKNKSGDKLDFKSHGKTMKVNSEELKYENFENGFKRTTFNSSGRPYFVETVLYDSLGYLKSRSTRYVITQRRTAQEYAYNEHGWVKEKRKVSVEGDTTRYTFKYDEVGNLLSRESFINGKHAKHCEVVYLKDTMLPRAWLCKNLETSDIRITRYVFKFYEYPDKEE